ncbi:hypothetical protein EDC01DRAFT_782334 [Geopyxis carbonaria]|nr:hypothetical protein EDC01DRAFT_782334 [Geopyxis carbonaria]
MTDHRQNPSHHKYPPGPPQPAQSEDDYGYNHAYVAYANDAAATTKNATTAGRSDRPAYNTTTSAPQLRPAYSSSRTDHGPPQRRGMEDYNGSRPEVPRRGTEPQYSRRPPPPPPPRRQQEPRRNTEDHHGHRTEVPPRRQQEPRPQPSREELRMPVLGSDAEARRYQLLVRQRYLQGLQRELDKEEESEEERRVARRERRREREREMRELEHRHRAEGRGMDERGGQGGRAAR